jgi:hypothetical protein
MSPPPQESGPLNLLRPLLLLSYSAFYIPHTLFNLVATANLKPLTNFSSFKDHWFARFWTWFGPRSREAAAAKVTPLIQNNARGVLLDIGPGSGQWLFLFARAMNPSITKIYGVEPNAGLHAELRSWGLRGVCSGGVSTRLLRCSVCAVSPGRRGLFGICTRC